MKFNSKLAFLSSVAVLATSPLALAHKGARCMAAVDKPVAAAADGEVTIVEVKDGAEASPGGEVIAGGEVTDGGGTVIDKGEVTDVGEATGGEVVDVEATGGEVVDCPDHGGIVPIDWVKRGGAENPDVIFYNMAGGGPVALQDGGPAVFKGETAVSVREVGQDEKATGIVSKENFNAPLINREKKAPVALIKKGRVFLR